MLNQIGLGAALLAFALTALATPIIRAISRRKGLVCHPVADRWHAAPTALFGGVAIFMGAAAGLALLALADSGTAAGSGTGAAPVVSIFAAAALMFLTGLADDLVGLTPATKLMAQGVAGGLLVSLGTSMSITEFGWLNVFLTLFWFTAITNAFNLLDNMDGVTAGVAAVVGAVLAAGFAVAGQPGLAFVALVVAAASASFLIFNFRPASIFMGDAGSLFLGAMLASLGVAYANVSASGVTTAVLPLLLIFFIPILDTSLVTFTRVLANTRISQGGRDHLTHRLVTLGLSERSTAATLYALAAILGGFALLLRDPTPKLTHLGGGLLLVGILLLTGYLSRLHDYAPPREPSYQMLSRFLRNLLYGRRAVEVVFDIALFSLAYYGAFLLYYDGKIPAARMVQFENTLALILAVKLAGFNLVRVYQGNWRRASLPDLHRVIKGVLLGSALAVSAIFMFYRGAELPRSIFIMDGLLLGAFACGARLSFRSLDRFRERINASGEPTLVVGTDVFGELAVRVVQEVHFPEWRIIGFLSREQAERGSLIYGLPVLGTEADLAEVAGSRGVRNVVVTNGLRDANLMERLNATCESLGLRLCTLNCEIELTNGNRARAFRAGSALATPHR